MCGIAGEIAFRGSRADLESVRKMTEAMAERGPDGQGTWHGGWAGLGHRRLKVIDLTEAAAQPMVEDRFGLAVVFNGCIYNHHELRAELAEGYPFRSASDTEVILAAYDRWGEDFVEHLVGMFVIALVDQRRQCVVLARDRLGVKPLYLAQVGGRLRFASTLPALVAAGGVDTSINEVGLHHYLSWHSIVPAPATILAGVTKLPPATVRVVDIAGRTRDRVYWQPDYTRRPEHAGWDAQQWRDAVHGALRTAVQRRLVADVPVGVLLSGGLDSSLIVALLTEAGQQGLSTFSIGFDDAGDRAGDEFAYSDLVAEVFGTDHHRLHIGAIDLPQAVEDTVAVMTEPMTSHDVTAFYLLSQAVAEHVKVVQSGQGADEVFAGYAYHHSAATAPREAALDTFAGAFVDHDQAQLLAILEPEWLHPSDPSRARLADHLVAPGAATALDAVLRLDTHLLMADDPVKRVDNMTMAAGLEARVPFLDQDLVELAAACPPELKTAQSGKGILKDLGRRLLPAEVVDRPKGYFPVPALVHLQEPILAMVREALYAPEAKDRGLFRTDLLEDLLAEPNARHAPTGPNVLWQLGLLEMWLQRHGVG
ncbi:N-acetylglutaminylglutamine amidotransferase [Kocuria aegyptia]|uniref:asparagine synthase (glutamine-hydrolyzing) n=1 Tax=Kocuria aegyptia TaxID=330943 RepID=A0ABN2KKS0_9MICC